MNKHINKINIYTCAILLAIALSISLNTSQCLANNGFANQNYSGFLGSSLVSNVIKEMLAKTSNELIKTPVEPTIDRYKKQSKPENPVSFKSKHKLNKVYILGGAEIFPM
jgi:hypothetical protein